MLKMMNNARITGFHIVFKMLTVSVNVAEGTYSSPSATEGCYDEAEVAVWENQAKNGYKRFVTKACWKQVFDIDLEDDVAGYVTSEQLAQVIAWASQQ